MASERRSSTNGHTSDDIHATNPTLSLAVRSARENLRFPFRISHIPSKPQPSACLICESKAPIESAPNMHRNSRVIG